MLSDGYLENVTWMILERNKRLEIDKYYKYSKAERSM